MKFLFIDESSKQQNKNKYFFALTGLMIGKDKLINLENELRALKIKYGMKNLKALRGAMLKDEKLSCTSKIIEILKKNQVQILSSVLGRVALKDTENINNSYFGALTFLIERFFLHLRRE